MKFRFYLNSLAERILSSKAATAAMKGGVMLVFAVL